MAKLSDEFRKNLKASMAEDDTLIMTGKEIIESLFEEWSADSSENQGYGSFEDYASQVLWVNRDVKYKVDAQLSWAEEA